MTEATAALSIELTPPDLTPYRESNTGIPYVRAFPAAAPGPHVMVMALTHGNEIAGAIALDRLIRRGIATVRGRLTIAFGNVAAYARFDPAVPHRSRCVDEDLNRVWRADILEGPQRSVERDRARQLRPLIDTVDILLDLHSMTAPSPPLALAGMSEKSTMLARRVGVPEIVMRDAGHADGTRLRDYSRFADENGAAAALLVECGQHWRRATADFAYDVTLRFLAAVGAIDRPRPPSTAPQHVLDVTHTVTATGARFTFAREFRGLEIVPKAGTVIARDGDRPIATPYDNCVIVMPSAHALPGQTAVRLGRFRE